MLRHGPFQVSDLTPKGKQRATDMLLTSDNAESPSHKMIGEAGISERTLRKWSSMDMIRVEKLMGNGLNEIDHQFLIVEVSSTDL
jgi:hypothetical protein